MRVTGASGLQPDLEAARTFILRTNLKRAGARYGCVPTEMKTVLVSEPGHVILKPMEWPEPEYEDATQHQHTNEARNSRSYRCELIHYLDPESIYLTRARASARIKKAVMAKKMVKSQRAGSRGTAQRAIPKSRGLCGHASPRREDNPCFWRSLCATVFLCSCV